MKTKNILNSHVRFRNTIFSKEKP